jgi:hypothetical protein
MGNALTAADIARIEALLSRLDPAEDAICRVPGCVHLHSPAAVEETAPALAA